VKVKEEKPQEEKTSEEKPKEEKISEEEAVNGKPKEIKK
jgi:hypothetical protein